MSSTNLSIGIVGFPNVGKSTLFEALTKNKVDRFNYPFCTIDPNIGVVTVPDDRLQKLANLFNPEKIINSTVKFIDIAGIIEGASKGDGLGNRFLANIRETDLILFVLRSFINSDIINARDQIDPVAEAKLLNTELMLKDLETIENRIRSASREAKSGKSEIVAELNALEKAKKELEDGNILADVDFSEKERDLLYPYRFLTMKPRIYLLNGDEDQETESLLGERWPVISINILDELDYSNLLQEEKDLLGISGIDRLIKKAYDLLDLITFFTVGSDEVRAWKTKKGTYAPKAAGVIHTDFEDKFIKAEVINWEDLIEVGSIVEAKKRGLIRTEGKDYLFQDGDVVEIKHGR
jgi:ribosome-binding ATPase YchF (GTP1/OBG family)